MHAKTFFYLCIGFAAAVGLVFSQLPPEVLLIVVVIVVVLSTIFTDEEHLDRNNLPASQAAIAATTKAANPVPVGSSGNWKVNLPRRPPPKQMQLRESDLRQKKLQRKGT